MKKSIVAAVLVASIVCFSFSVANARDQRAMSLEAEAKKREMLQKAEKEKADALRESQETLAGIKNDRNALTSSVATIKEETEALERRRAELEKRLAELDAREKELSAAAEEMSSEIKELVGFVRINAKDLEKLFRQSPQSALLPDRSRFADDIRDENRFPDMADIEKTIRLLLDETRMSGEVRLQKGTIVDRNGAEVEVEILILGNFTAAYRHEGETGFLIYSEASGRFFALSKLPPRRLQRELADYMKGASDDVPMDISRGGALRQLAHELTLAEQIPKGGPIVWPILAILALGLLIVLERLFFLFRYSIDADKFMKKIADRISQGRWEECGEYCSRLGNKAVPKVIMAGIEARDLDRYDLENALQEKILREIPRLERFLSTLGILAGIAPLLGLLGTVAGMIETFHVITYFGTGDPRMMSGGISEALVTTMLGLSAAIPLMLCHTLLTRKVDTLVSQMEEKAVAFVNTVYACRN